MHGMEAASQRPMSHRRAFTIVEMLVVIAIIGLLVALLMPAIQLARESGRQVQCRGNLRQFALACQQFHQVHNAFPVKFVGPQTGFPSNWGVHVQLLPFLEQQPLFNSLLPGGLPSVYAASPPTISSLTTQPLLGRTIAVFTCPSDLGDATNPFFAGYGKTNYMPSGEATDLKGQAQVTFTSQEGVTMTDDRPLPVTAAAIRDGLSSTILWGERALARSGGLPSVGGVWVGRPNGHSNVAAHGRADWPPNTAWPGNPGLDSLNPRDPNCICHGWTSLHPGGLNVAMCDGAVSFISESIDSAPSGNCNPNTANRVYQNLFRKNDRNIVGAW
jgi:prepilin-type N-terminal cleavage/methylation domain-containing protein/prepilin-type processing-associated H-X9-DG protein